MRYKRTIGVLAVAGAFFANFAGVSGADDAGGGTTSGGLASLKTIRIPNTNFSGYLRTDASGNVTSSARAAAIALGKALFWDMQTGGDGKQACASCHFNAGADSRSKNQLNPGAAGVFQVGARAANYQLQASDFPLHQLSDPTNRRSVVLRDSANIVGSQGLYHYIFNDVVPGGDFDDGTVLRQTDPGGSDIFNVGGLDTRRVTGKNTPSVINAVFNFRNFWDGRAQNIFNGVNPSGANDSKAFVLKLVNGSLQPVQVRISNAALASQAVGPPNNPTEMSFDGRDFKKLGKKMLSLNALAKQQVAATDSVLGIYSNSPSLGMSDPSNSGPLTYSTLIQAAFDPAWWSDTQDSVDANGNPPTSSLGPTYVYSQIEFNFSLFWGIAIQMYESTLVADDSRFDQYMDGNKFMLSAQEINGMKLFSGKGGCTQCHMGAELTDASVGNQARAASGLPGNPVKGFHMTGVRPVSDDQIIGGGAAKTAALRNVELTAPYFHNGGNLSLEDAVAFYGRGGDFGTRGVDQDGRINVIGFSPTEIAAVAAFLKSMTDERVRAQRAPFDHPSIDIPQGSEGDTASITEEGTSGRGKDGTMFHVNATGRNGGTSFPKFLNLP